MFSVRMFIVSKLLSKDLIAVPRNTFNQLQASSDVSQKCIERLDKLNSLLEEDIKNKQFFFETCSKHFGTLITCFSKSHIKPILLSALIDFEREKPHII